MSDEISTLVTQLREACATLDQLAQSDYPQTLRNYTCAQIYEEISRAVYQGRRCSPHWSKPELVSAYIAIKKKLFEARREGTLRQLADYGVGRARALAAIRQPPGRRKPRG